MNTILNFRLNVMCLSPSPLIKQIILLLSCFFLLGSGFSGLADAKELTTPQPTPQKIESKSFSFLVFGDSGSGNAFQYKVAEQMQKVSMAHPFSFALILGDIIYPIGNFKTLGDSRFKKPYGFLLNQGIPFYVALGNHDVAGGFGKQAVSFYQMPGRYYSYSKGPIDFFALDTNDFSSTQQAWLKGALSKSIAPWKIVYGHHPVFSSGHHGSSTALEKSLKPILENYKVNLYLAGHDHDYERFNPIQGVHYIISGGGGASIRPFYKIHPSSLVRASKYHFLCFTLTHGSSSVLKFEAYDMNGALLDSGTL
jgi:hypothetical protein